MKSLERFLISLDSWPWSAVSRVALGLGIPPVFRVLSGGRDSVWISLALFIGLLVALRVVPAVLRHVLPFSVEAKEIWAERRNIAKLHDSYQWQKLFWIGLGLLPYAVIGDGLRNGELVVTLFCLIGGGAGLFFWRRVNEGLTAAALCRSVRSWSSLQTIENLLQRLCSRMGSIPRSKQMRWQPPSASPSITHPLAALAAQISIDEPRAPEYPVRVSDAGQSSALWSSGARPRVDD